MNRWETLFHYIVFQRVSHSLINYAFWTRSWWTTNGAKESVLSVNFSFSRAFHPSVVLWYIGTLSRPVIWSYLRYWRKLKEEREKRWQNLLDTKERKDISTHGDLFIADWINWYLSPKREFLMRSFTNLAVFSLSFVFFFFKTHDADLK